MLDNSPSSTDPTGDLIDQVQEALGDDIEIVRRIGEGRAAAVYLGHQRALDRRVAVKVAFPRSVRDRTAVVRFQREARAMAGSPHPNIVPVHSVGTTKLGVPYFVMEYIEGETLEQRLERKGRLSPSEAVRIVGEVAAALTHAHERGLVHRDVKPANILIEEGTGRVLITDFGLAKLTAADSKGHTLTGKGELVGEPAYMSPEQAEKGAVDPRSDQYSLAVVAYELLAGRRPFAGPSTQDYVHQHALETPPSLAEAAPEVPAHVVRVIDRALMKEPAARFSSAESFGEALRSAIRPGTARASSGGVDWGWLRDRRYLIQTAAIYAGVGWGVLEVLSWVLETFGLPMTLRQPALWLVVAGFPIVMLAVWWLRRTSSPQRTG